MRVFARLKEMVNSPIRICLSTMPNKSASTKKQSTSPIIPTQKKSYGKKCICSYSAAKPSVFTVSNSNSI